MKDKIRIVYAEDERLMRESMSRLLREEGIEIIAEAEDGIQLLNVLKKISPDLVLLDIQMKGMDGNETLKQIREKYDHIKVVILSSFTEEWLIEDFRKKGAAAYLTKNSELSTIVNTIKRIHHLPGYHNFRSEVRSIFTKKEMQTIPLFLSGKTSKEIGINLGVSAKAIEAAKSRLYEKTKCRNSTEFANYCTKEGLEFLGNRV